MSSPSALFCAAGGSGCWRCSVMAGCPFRWCNLIPSPPAAGNRAALASTDQRLPTIGRVFSRCRPGAAGTGRRTCRQTRRPGIDRLRLNRLELAVDHRTPRFGCGLRPWPRVRRESVNPGDRFPVRRRRHGDGAAQQDAHRWQQQQHRKNVREQTRKQQQRAGGEHAGAVEGFDHRKSACIQALLHRAANAKALVADDRRAENAGGDDHSQGWPKPPDGARLDQRHDIEDGQG